MITPNYTTDDVQAFREENQCSVFDALSHFRRNQLLEILEGVRHTGNVNDLVDVIEELVKRTRMT